ncbi:MAG TPA: hypothetical protein VL335_03185 [Candidatus Paceibacterota bacterium]|nr:hypothetical protein [Candidatus Paceibacterota bacterium]
MKKTLLVCTLVLGVALLSHAQPPPPGGGGGGTNTVSDPPPPTSGLILSGIMTPEGKLPWLRNVFPQGDENMTNFNSVNQSFLDGWTNDTVVRPGDVLTLGMPLSSTNITTNWPAFHGTAWWLETNGLGVITRRTNLMAFYMPAGQSVAVLKIGVSNTITGETIFSDSAPMFHALSAVWPTNDWVFTCIAGTNVDQIMDYIAQGGKLEPVDPFPPIYIPNYGWLPCPPDFVPPKLTSGLTGSGYPILKSPLKLMTIPSDTLTFEQISTNTFVTSVDFSVWGPPYRLYHLDMNRDLNTTNWLPVTNSAVWLDSDGYGRITMKITNDWGDKGFFKLEGHMRDPNFVP